MLLEELASKLNVLRQVISKWEMRESNLDFDKIEPLCEIFEITADELIRDKKVEDVLKYENNDNEIDEYKKWQNKEGLVLAGSVLLYFLSLVWILFVFESRSRYYVWCFFIIYGVATSILVYYYVV